MTKKQLENKFTLARRAFENQHFDEAYSYYKEILSEEPDDFEAGFRSILSRANISTLASFKEVASSFKFEIPRLLKLDCIQNLNEEELFSIIETAVNDFTNTIITCAQASSAHYIQFQSLPESMSEFRSQMMDLSFACGSFGEAIYNSFKSEKIKGLCVPPLKNAVNLLKRSAAGLPAYVFATSRDTLDSYTYKIRKFEPDYVNPCPETPKKENTKPVTNSTSSSTSSKKLNSFAKFILFLSIPCIIGGIIACCSGEDALPAGVGLLLFGVFELIFVPKINKLI